MSLFVLVCRSWFVAMVLGCIALSAGEQSAATGNVANTVDAPMPGGSQSHNLTAFDTASLDHAVGWHVIRRARRVHPSARTRPLNARK